MWVLLGEMFNNRIRGSALAVGAGVQWVANFVVSTSFPPIAYNLGVGAAYGLYTIFAALSFGFVAMAIKETKGKELGRHGLRPVEIHREFMTAAARWIMALKLWSVLSALAWLRLRLNFLEFQKKFSIR